MFSYLLIEEFQIFSAAHGSRSRCQRQDKLGYGTDLGLEMPKSFADLLLGKKSNLFPGKINEENLLPSPAEINVPIGTVSLPLIGGSGNQ